MKTEFDFVVIGGGSAGYAAARSAVVEGLSVAVVDGAPELGGLCILRGCMPSKTLIESANRNVTIRRAAEFGLKAQGGAPDVRVVRDRKRALIADFAGYRQGQLQDGRFTLLRGSASFEDPHTLRVAMHDGSQSIVKLKTACIATGSVVQLPPVPGLVETGCWTSDDILDTDKLPASMIVLGGGAIALEMAHYLDGMGVKVTLIQRGASPLSSMDKECGEAVAEAFVKRGIAVHCGTRVLKAEAVSGGKRVTFEQGGEEKIVVAEQILAATGRTPAVEGLVLDKADVQLNERKIAVNKNMQTTQPHIFAAGDVCSPLDVVHVAIQQGEVAAKNAAALINDHAERASVDMRLALLGVFCEPQAAMVGASEAALSKQGVPFITANYPFNDHGKSMVMGETEGFVKLIAHAETGELLGGSCVGPHATELIHEIVVAMHFHATAKQLASIPHYHPTLSEIWTYPAEELADKLHL